MIARIAGISSGEVEAYGRGEPLVEHPGEERSRSRATAKRMMPSERQRLVGKSSRAECNCSPNHTRQIFHANPFMIESDCTTQSEDHNDFQALFYETCNDL